MSSLPKQVSQFWNWSLEADEFRGNMNLYMDVTTAVIWQGHPTGIARVVKNLSMSMARNFSRITLLAMGASGFVICDESMRKTSRKAVFSPDDVLFSAGANWDIENYNGYLNEAKELGVVVSVLFHDAIPVLFPHFYGPGFAKIYEAWLLDTLRLVDHVVSISESTKNDLVAICREHDIAVPPIDVVRNGDKLPLKDVAETSASTKDSDGYILSVGTLEYRKNHTVLVNAYRMIITDGLCERSLLPRLVIVGRPGWMDCDLVFQIGNDPQLEGLIEIVSDISDVELDGLYRNCLFTVFPAIYEGWGLPVAESLAYGKQCITSDSSSMKEIAPELTWFAHPLKVDSWAEAILALALDPSTLEAENARVSSEYAITSWKDSAESVYGAIVKMMIKGEG